MAKKIAITNNKGGTGKTTTVVNLSGVISMNERNAKILIVEGDGQGNSSASFKINPNKVEKTMYDVFMGTERAEDCIINAYQNIDIIPSNNDMNFLEFDEMSRMEDKVKRDTFKTINELIKRNIDLSKIEYSQFEDIVDSISAPTTPYFNLLDGKLDKLDEMYDYIIFDTPPELKAVTSSILAIADSVIIPFEPELYAIDGLKNILSRIFSIQDEYNENLQIAGVLATKVRNKTMLHNEVIRGIIKMCMHENINYFQTEISHSIRFADLNAYHGVPATIAKPKNDFSKLYYSLFDELRSKKFI